MCHLVGSHLLPLLIESDVIDPAQIGSMWGNDVLPSTGPLKSQYQMFAGRNRKRPFSFKRFCKHNDHAKDTLLKNLNKLKGQSSLRLSIIKYSVSSSESRISCFYPWQRIENNLMDHCITAHTCEFVISLECEFLYCSIKKWVTTWSLQSKCEFWWLWISFILVLRKYLFFMNAKVVKLLL